MQIFLVDLRIYVYPARGGRKTRETRVSNALHDSAAALLRMIIAYDLTGVASEALSKIIGTEVRIGDGRDWHRDAVTVGV